MNPEEKARQQIDRILESVGWCIQDLRDFNLGASLGVAIREFPLQSGKADYLLFVDRRATDRFHVSDYEYLSSTGNPSLDIFWLKDDSLEDSDSLPDPDILAREIVENLQAALDQFNSVYQELGDR